MRSPGWMIIAASACLLLAGCSAPVDGRPVVHIVEAAKRSVSLPPDQVLPTADELTTTLGIAAGGFMGQLVEGGADVLLQGIHEADATPGECVSPTYRLQEVVYQDSPVRSVATRSWAGGDHSGPSFSGFFGVVKLATPADAEAFFAASADKWRRCNGQTLVLHRPERAADGLSRITDVVIDNRIVSAVVMHEARGSGSSTIQRALGVELDCIVDVEVTELVAQDGDGRTNHAVDIAKLMLSKLVR